MAVQVSNEANSFLFCIKLSERLQSEWYRLSSFKNWNLSIPVRPQNLARNGFFSSDENTATCVSCGLQIKYWNETTVDISAIHLAQSPQCSFAQKNPTENIPLAVSSDSHLSLNERLEKFDLFDADKEIHSSHTRQNLPSNESLSSHVMASEQSHISHLNKDGNIHQATHGYPLSNGVGNLPVDFPQHSTLFSNKDQSHSLPAGNVAKPPSIDFHSHPPLISSMQRGITGDLIPGSGISPTPPGGQLELDRHTLQNMRLEELRLQTFAQFDASDVVRPEDLAKAGFFYTGPNDRVRCVFCNLNLHNWVKGDNVYTEHKKHSPHCPFLRGQPVGNIPIGSSAAEAKASEAAGSFVDNVILRHAKNPTMTDEAVRLETFQNWPSNAALKAADLAKAGFYYAGISDHVKCFFCEGGLRNWEEDDDPWTEHARWFPKCGFVRENKGDAFIHAVKQQFSSQEEPEVVNVESAASSGNAQSSDPNDYMNRIEVKQVMEMGFPRDMICRAIDEKLKNEGQFPDTSSLLEALLEIQASMQRTRDVERSELPCSDPPSVVSRGLTSPVAASSAPVDVVKGEVSGKTKKKNKQKKKNPSPKAAPQEAQLTEEENEKLQKRIKEIEEQRLCKVCMDAEFNIVFLPCGHLVCCSSCAPALRSCPICRHLIRGTVRTYWS